MMERIQEVHALIPDVSLNTFIRIVRKDPRVIEITPKNLLENAGRTGTLLHTTRQEFFKLAFRQPALLFMDPWKLRLKTRSLAKWFGIRPKDLLPVIRKNPALITRAECSIHNVVQAMADHFMLEAILAKRLILKHPTLVNVSIGTIASNLETGARLLEIPLAAYTKAALKQPQLFYQSPHTILRNVAATSKHLGIAQASFVSIALGMPSLLFRSPDGMPRKVRLIRALMHYTRDERTLEEFLHASKAALTYSPERILSRCLIARSRLANGRANTLLAMGNKSATALLRDHLKAIHGRDVYPVYRRWKRLGLITAE
jgi:hypothetical protein